MHFGIVRAAATVAAFSLAVSLSIAAESKSPTPAEASGKVNATQKSDSAKKGKAAAKLVDINGASKTELKKLPGIGDAEADKIIAGRPYRTKAELVTRNVISEGIYEGLKRKIIAKQK